MAIMACSQSNFDGYAFSVYGGGGNCDSLECISGEYDVGIDDNDKCAFGTAEISRPMTKFIFQTLFMKTTLLVLYLRFVKDSAPCFY